MAISDSVKLMNYLTAAMGDKAMAELLIAEIEEVVAGEIAFDMDDVDDGTTYAKVLSSSLTTNEVVKVTDASGDDMTVSLGGSNRILTLGANVSIDQDLQQADSPTFAGLTVVNAIDEFSTDGTLAGDSDTAVPTEKAVKLYVDTQIIAHDTFLELNDTPGAYTTPTALYRINAAGDAVEETTVLITEPGANQFTLTKGTGIVQINAGTLSVTASCTLDQDLQQSASVQFGTISDGTFSVTAGAFTGVASISDGTASWSSSNLSGFGTIAQAGNYDNTLGAGDNVTIDGLSTPQTQTDGTLEVNTSSATAGVSGITINNIKTADVNNQAAIKVAFESTTTAGALGNVAYGYFIEMTGLATDSDIEYIHFKADDFTAAGGVSDAIAFEVGANFDTAFNIGSAAPIVWEDQAGEITTTRDSSAAGDNLVIHAGDAYAASGLAGGLLQLYGGAGDGAGADSYVKIGQGAGSPSVITATDDDLYVLGQVEIDGLAVFDGAIDANSTSNFADKVVISDTSARTDDMVSITMGSTGTPVDTANKYPILSLFYSTADSANITTGTYSEGIGAGENLNGVHSSVYPDAADNATSTMSNFMAQLDNTAASSTIKTAYMGMALAGSFDYILSCVDHTMIIAPYTSSGAGDDVNLYASAAIAASGANGGDVVIYGGAKDGAGNDGMVHIGHSGGSPGHVTTDDDIYINGGFEADGNSWVDATLTATTLSDGTASLTGGTISDGTFSVAAGAFTAVASITDGTASWSGNNLSGFTSISGTTLTDGTFSVSAGAISGVTTINAGGSISFSGDITDYEPTNDANPQFVIGAVAGDDLVIQTVYDAGAQTLDYVNFESDSSSAVGGGADKGEFRFTVDGTLILTVDDGGLEIVGGITDGTASWASNALSGFTTIGCQGDVTIYKPTNDASPAINLGSSAANDVVMQSVYDAGAQTLDYVSFLSTSGNAGADKGQFKFNCDGNEILRIDDDGIEVDGDITIQDNQDIILDTTNGTKIGTAAAQKIGFFGHAPTSQLLKANYNNWAAFGDVVDALVAIGLFDAA